MPADALSLTEFDRGYGAIVLSPEAFARLRATVEALAVAQADLARKRTWADEQLDALHKRLACAREDTREACARYFATRDTHAAGPAIIRETPLDATPLAEQVRLLPRSDAIHGLIPPGLGVYASQGLDELRDYLGEERLVCKQLRARAEAAEAELAAESALVTALQAELAAERVAHFETARERDRLRVAFSEFVEQARCFDMEFSDDESRAEAEAALAKAQVALATAPEETP